MRLSRATATAAAALSALTILLAPAARAARPGDTVALPVRDALQGLVVSDEDRTGYSRDKFRHWIDADRDGCNTRAEVLLAEAVTAPEQGPRCVLTGGSWFSPYDDQYLDSARQLDVDHLLSAPSTAQLIVIAGQSVSGMPLSSIAARGERHVRLSVL